jgi:hypothetical protein
VLLDVQPHKHEPININSKWTKDLNIRPEALKVVKKRAGNTFELLCIGNDVLSSTQKAQQLKERIDKWDYMKLKRFCTTTTKK